MSDESGLCGVAHWSLVHGTCGVGVEPGVNTVTMKLQMEKKEGSISLILTVAKAKTRDFGSTTV